MTAAGICMVPAVLVLRLGVGKAQAGLLNALTLMLDEGGRQAKGHRIFPRSCPANVVEVLGGAGGDETARASESPRAVYSK